MKFTSFEKCVRAILSKSSPTNEPAQTSRNRDRQMPSVKGERISLTPHADPVVRRCVRVLRMVHELHKAGYQKLRILPYLSASGAYWRAQITSADNVKGSDETPVLSDLVVDYSSSEEDRYFGWDDASGKCARELAVMFQERFPAICEHAQGIDWAYAGWLTDVLGQAERAQSGRDLVVLIVDWRLEQSYLDRWLPPPPYLAD